MARPRIRLRRVYDAPDAADGSRVLVERLWPRGLSKAAAQVDYWAREVAPSADLRKWFGHDPQKWETFRRRYFAELEAMPDAVEALRQRIAAGPVTFVFAAREERFNNAVALRDYLSR